MRKELYHFIFLNFQVQDRQEWRVPVVRVRSPRAGSDKGLLDKSFSISKYSAVIA